MFSMVWCHCATSCTCCLIHLSIQLLQSPGALADPDISHLSLFQFSFHSHCALTAMKVTCVVSPDSLTAMLQSSAAWALFICLSIQNFLIILPIWLPPSWIAIVTGSSLSASHHMDHRHFPQFPCPASSNH